MARALTGRCVRRALTSSVCEAPIVMHSGVVPVLHFSTWLLCRKRVLKRDIAIRRASPRVGTVKQKK
jgi:hypothetical protein